MIKLSESMWADAHRKNIGVEIRKESILHPETILELRSIILKEVEKQGDVVDLNFIDVSGVPNMYHIFSDIKAKELKIDKWDVSHIDKFSCMFDGCTNLEKIEIGGWNVRSANNMAYMFRNCESLQEIDLRDWDTSKVKQMMGIFCGCKKLVHIHADNWDTNKVEGMSDMFRDCHNLKIIDGQNWSNDNEKLEHATQMFAYCNSLKQINLPNLNMKNVSHQRIFLGCESHLGMENDRIIVL